MRDAWVLPKTAVELEGLWKEKELKFCHISVSMAPGGCECLWRHLEQAPLKLIAYSTDSDSVRPRRMSS